MATSRSVPVGIGGRSRLPDVVVVARAAGLVQRIRDFGGESVSIALVAVVTGPGVIHKTVVD
jgi:hypothetical protein